MRTILINYLSHENWRASRTPWPLHQQEYKSLQPRALTEIITHLRIYFREKRSETKFTMTVKYLSIFN